MNKSKRAAGFAAIAAGYAAAAFVGLILFGALKGDVKLRLLAADAVATVVIYLLSLITENASFYDPYWSVQPAVITGTVVIARGTGSAGTLIFFCILLWSIRLTANWAYTFHGLAFMDWRYEMLKEKTGKWYPLVNLFGIQLFPTFVVYCCTLPAFYAVSTGAEANALTYAGAIICAAAVALQLVSDIDMQRFRKDAANKGRIIRTGLWKNSRHPNYLGEIMMWWGVYIMGSSAVPENWYLAAGAVINTVMFVFISIPMAEKRLRGYKSCFDEYAACTRMLLPLPRRNICKQK